MWKDRMRGKFVAWLKVCSRMKHEIVSLSGPCLNFETVRKLTLKRTGSVYKYKQNIEARSCRHCYRGKAISITYSECLFVSAVLQHAMRVRHIGICGLSGSVVFFTLSCKRHNLRKKKNLKCVIWFFLQLLSDTFLIIRTEGDVIKNVYRSSFKVPVILVRF